MPSLSLTASCELSYALYAGYGDGYVYRDDLPVATVWVNMSLDVHVFRRYGDNQADLDRTMSQVKELLIDYTNQCSGCPDKWEFMDIDEPGHLCEGGKQCDHGSDSTHWVE